MTPQFEAVDPLSPRAVIAGMLVGFVVSAMNVSFGLKAGWGQGGSVLAAAVSIGLFSAIKPKIPFTQLEANVCQTVASAAGSMTMAAGLIGPIPALHLLGMRYSVWTMMTWGRVRGVPRRLLRGAPASALPAGVAATVPVRDRHRGDHKVHVRGRQAREIAGGHARQRLRIRRVYRRVHLVFSMGASTTIVSDARDDVRRPVGLGRPVRRDARGGRDTDGDTGRAERVSRGDMRVGLGGAVDGFKGLDERRSAEHEGRGEGFVTVAGGDDDGGGLADATGAGDGVQTEEAEKGGEFEAREQ